MKREEFCRVEDALRTLPLGTFQIDDGPWAGEGERHLQARTDGRVRMERCPVFPGVVAAFNTCLAEWVSLRHDAASAVLEIHYCRGGRVGWNMQDGMAIYLGAGDLTVQAMDCCADSAMTFPLGFAEGIAFVVDLDRLEADCPDILREAGFSVETLREKFCGGMPVVIPACQEVACIFEPLCTAPAALRRPYLQLKAQELLLYLSTLSVSGREWTRYGAQQIALIQEIHSLLTEHLDQRFTIEELSRRYAINSSSLKELFKAVYGLPIATYMKEYRIHRAMELLRETDDQVSDIAAQVGYESQGKFAQAFKDVTQTLPTAYRKWCRGGG